MKLLWINCNQFETLKHFERCEVHGVDITHPIGIPSYGSFQACFKKGLLAKVEGFYTLTDLGREALNAYPNPIPLELDHEHHQRHLALQ